MQHMLCKGVTINSTSNSESFNVFAALGKQVDNDDFKCMVR